MEDTEFQEGDIFRLVNFDDLEQLDWDNLFTGLPDGLPSLPTKSPPPIDVFNSSPDSVSSWIGQLENVLMEDDDDWAAEPSLQISENFFADILVDSPPGSAEVADASTDKDSAASDHGNSGASETEKESEKIVPDRAEVKNDDEDPDDHISKKLRRQLRNRDAAVRSRERKKMYVRDLEIKSRYLEGECRRLGRLLQCFVAENQALRLSLQKDNAFGVSSAKQESAVLLLESLLLGSLLWFLGIMCLFTLPKLPHLTLVAVPLENEEKKMAEKGAGSKMVIGPLMNSRRCKASRTRMKTESISDGVLV
ncbi:hypothetical protein JCGZ_08021 [Jatropha curcas]|uniref:BZIP domain-containing protein n=1 Tax=Jatropha curcas TaxID=180498 RepID=A0A067KWW7_JATCU|nr:hypothetical protein JCGZ_08021 [Jatropha curcas]